MDILIPIVQPLLISVASATTGLIIGKKLFPGDVSKTDKRYSTKWFGISSEEFFGSINMGIQGVVAGIGLLLILPSYGVEGVAIFGLASGVLMVYVGRNLRFV